jgi:hypothetical protein
MTARPRRGTPTACALLVALMMFYAAILLLLAPRRAGAAASPSPPQPIRAVAPMRAFNDSWEQAALLAQQATGGVIVEVDAEDAANTFEVDVVRKGVEIDLDVNVVTGRIVEIGRWPAGD